MITSSYWIFPTEREDLEALGCELSVDDQIEALADFGSWNAIDRALSNADISDSYTVLDNNENIISAYGTGNSGSATYNQNTYSVGRAWFLSTHRLDSHCSAAARIAKPTIKLVAEKYDHVFANVYMKNKKTRKWLKYMGFIEGGKHTEMGYIEGGFVTCVYFASEACKEDYMIEAEQYRIARANEAA